MVDLSTPDSEVGTVDFNGWAGLYLDFPEEGWYMIKWIGPTGSREWVAYEESVTPHVIVWADVEKNLEPSYDEPEEGDWIIQDKPQGGYDVGDKEFSLYPDAVEYVRQKCIQDAFYPTIWFMDDHGGFTNIGEEVWGTRE